MNETIVYKLFFEEKDGKLSAQLPPEVREAMLRVCCWVPWSDVGKRGLLCCSEDSFEQAVRIAQKDAPLIGYLINRLAFQSEIGPDGRLHLPLPAAQFARIRDRAVLLQLDTELLLLMPKKPPDEPKEGKVIRGNFPPAAPDSDHRI